MIDAVSNDGNLYILFSHDAFFMTIIKRGLDLPISGQPVQRIESTVAVSQVAIIGDDFIGMKPTMLVAEHDTVMQGQPLLEDKKCPGVFYTAPASGKVVAPAVALRRSSASAARLRLPSSM